jgi:hypothetical protein
MGLKNFAVYGARESYPLYFETKDEAFASAENLAKQSAGGFAVIFQVIAEISSHLTTTTTYPNTPQALD